jgi:hypothetical protein
LAVVELEAKLSGQIETGQKNVTINLQTVSPEEALEYARDILEFFGSGAIANAAEAPLTIDAEAVESCTLGSPEQEDSD